jgi:PleD family two-component response regulator
MERLADPGNPVPSRQPRILIVDDVETVRRGLRSILGEAVCGEAENGQEAIHKVMQLHPDVIALDWSMPVMSGLEAARAIRSLAPETKIIVFSIHDGVSIGVPAWTLQDGETTEEFLLVTSGGRNVFVNIVRSGRKLFLPKRHH